jgi:acetyltransferase-like isoleucine patch superfamily enzyme
MVRIIVSKVLILFHYLLWKVVVSNSSKIKFEKGFLIWKSKIKISGKENTITFGKWVNIKNTNITINGNNNTIYFGESFKIYEKCNILIEGDNCIIFLGEKSTLGSGNLFCGEGNTKICIGKNCMLSREVYMNTSDFHSIMDATSQKRINPPQDIFIDDHVWVGFNTTISKGAVLGKNSIVASRSLVSGKEFPSNVILAGIPAKIIKENINWSREKLPY